MTNEQWQQNFEQEQRQVLEKVFENWNAVIFANIQENLKRRIAGTFSGCDDDIFGAHTAFVKFSLGHRWTLAPSTLWEGGIKASVEQTEQEMSAKGAAKPRIHKGAPLFNVGLAYLASGDIERAFAYIAAAGEENARCGRGMAFHLLIGDDALSRNLLVVPLASRYFASWGNDYRDISGDPLDLGNFCTLLKKISINPWDGIQLMLAMHRFLKGDTTITNDATNHLSTRALAETLVAFESALRRVQPSIQGELNEQIGGLCAHNLGLKNAFDSIKSEFDTKFVGKAAKRCPAALNWVVTQTFARIPTESAAAAKAGIACFLLLRIRNNLLHRVEETLDIFAQHALRERCMGVALAGFRLIQHHAESTLASL